MENTAQGGICQEINTVRGSQVLCSSQDTPKCCILSTNELNQSFKWYIVFPV